MATSSTTQERMSPSDPVVGPEGDDIDLQLLEAERSKAILKERRETGSVSASKEIVEEKRRAEQELQSMLEDDDTGGAQSEPIQALERNEISVPASAPRPEHTRDTRGPSAILSEPPRASAAGTDSWDAFFSNAETASSSPIQDISRTALNPGSQRAVVERPVSTPSRSESVPPGVAAAPVSESSIPAVRVPEPRGVAGLNRQDIGTEGKQMATKVVREGTTDPHSLEHVGSFSEETERAARVDTLIPVEPGAPAPILASSPAEIGADVTRTPLGTRESETEDLRQSTERFPASREVPAPASSETAGRLSSTVSEKVTGTEVSMRGSTSVVEPPATSGQSAEEASEIRAAIAGAPEIKILIEEAKPSRVPIGMEHGAEEARLSQAAALHEPEERAVLSEPGSGSGLRVKEGDSPLKLAGKLYAARAAEFGYRGDTKEMAALERWAARLSSRHIVGQWLVEHAEDSAEPLAKKFFEDSGHAQLLVHFKESGDQKALNELVRELRVGEFNDILKEKIPNLSRAGGRIELDRQGNILSFDPQGNRLLGHVRERRPVSQAGEDEPVSSRRERVPVRERLGARGSVSGETDAHSSYASFWERSGFERSPIARSVAEQAGITPQELDRREELLLDFWGKHPHVIPHDSPREARHLFETLSLDLAELESQLSFLDHFAYRRETLPEAGQVLRIADVLAERVAATDIYRSILANYEAVRRVEDTARQADIVELFLSHGASKQPLERLTLGWNRTLFRSVSASLDESLDLRVRFLVRGSAAPVDLIMYRNGRIAVDGDGVDGNWPARHFRANAMTLTNDSLREALAFINRSDGEGAVLLKQEHHEGTRDRTRFLASAA